MNMNLIKRIAGNLTYTLCAEESDWKYSLSIEEKENIEYVHLKMECEREETPPSAELSWDVPSIDIVGIWHPETSVARTVIKEYFMPTCISSANTSAPVWCMFSQGQSNRCTVALSDAESIISFYNTLDEKDYSFHSGVKLFSVPQGEMSSYTLTLRVDRRDIPYYNALSSVTDWWAEEYTPLDVPPDCFYPHYSTWYSFHQSVNSDDVEKQCKLSKEIGCDAVIVDDGWQTPEVDVGYNDCGDWILSEEKFPDMCGHVDRVHAMGMKYLLWFPVPFIAVKSDAFARFCNKTLPYRRNIEGGTCLLDPRYPEVRDYLIKNCLHFVRDWKLDGLKLDFIDQFRQPEKELPDADPGRDYDSVPKALDFMLGRLISELRTVKPDIMIEFRQMYIGPVMRKYGNMFRAGDCADDILLNRVRTTDVRLISGNSSVHSDMLSWHKDERPEIAARQILNVIFSVLQISVRIDEITDEQKKMLAFWLGFAREHSEVLLKGNFQPQYPQLLYPAIISEKEDCLIAACYLPMMVSLKESAAKDIFIINASDSEKIVLELSDEKYTCRKTVYDCCGEITVQSSLDVQGITAIDVPVSGLLHLNYE